MTYIIRPIKNLAWDGVFELNSPDSYASIEEALPYKLRGSYFDGATRALVNEEGIRFHLDFSFEFWAQFHRVSGISTIFGKDKNILSNADDENLFEIRCVDEKLQLAIWQA